MRNDGFLEKGESGEKLLKFVYFLKVKLINFLMNFLDLREKKSINGECKDG